MMPFKLICCVTQGADDLGLAHSRVVGIERTDSRSRNHVHVADVRRADRHDVDLYGDDLVTTVGLLDDLRDGSAAPEARRHLYLLTGEHGVVAVRLGCTWGAETGGRRLTVADDGGAKIYRQSRFPLPRR